IRAREAAATTPGVATVGVDHDLAAGQPRIGDRPADHKAPGRIDEGPDLTTAHLHRDDRGDHVLGDVRTHLFRVDLIVMLGRKHHVVDAARTAVVPVTHRDLYLPVAPPGPTRLVA